MSCVGYLRGQFWLPYVIAERLAFTGALILHSALADLRKLSPELGLLARLPDHQKISWWELTMGWKNSPVQRMLATFGELATNAAPPLPPLELLPDPAVDAAMDVLQANENEVLWRQGQNLASDRQACAPHRLDTRPDNRIAAKDHRRELQLRRPKSGLRRDHRNEGQRQHSRGSRQDQERPRRGNARRAIEQARLVAVDETRVRDARSALAGGVGGRP